MLMTGTETKISLRVHPGAVRSEIVGFTDGLLEVRVAAPPVKGKANKELIDVLTRALSVSRGDITIVRGHTSRSKVITVDGLSQEDIIKHLAPQTFSSGGATG